MNTDYCFPSLNEAVESYLEAERKSGYEISKSSFVSKEQKSKICQRYNDKLFEIWLKDISDKLPDKRAVLIYLLGRKLKLENTTRIITNESN